MIPLSVPNLSGNEWVYIKECLDTNWVSSVGSYVTLFENKVAQYCGSKHAIAISNGTSALHISLMLAGVEREDLVVLPNITFVASANSIKYTGADPILIDVEADTWQMDLDLLLSFLEKETILRDNKCVHKVSQRIIRCIMPVHLLGNLCDMDKLMAIAAKFCLSIVEDATESLGSTYKDKPAGTFGLLGCLSFNGNKIITTGGGGIIITDDDTLAKKAKHLTTQAKADPNEYYHDEVGYNYRLVNILAAMGVAQMEQLEGFIARKKEIATLYNQGLADIEGFENQKIIPSVNANHWLYTVRLPKQKELLLTLRDHKIEARPFWVPMNQLPAMHNDLYVSKTDISNDIYKNCLSLPCSTNITDAEILQVVNVIKSVLC